MERVAADIEGIHLGIADLDALLVGPLVENAFDLHPPESIRRTGLHAQLDSLIFARRLSLTLANFGSARGSVVCRVNRYARQFFYGPGLAVTVKKFTHPIFCASNHR